MNSSEPIKPPIFVIRKKHSIFNPWLMRIGGELAYGPLGTIFVSRDHGIHLETFYSKEKAQQFIDSHPICDNEDNIICEITTTTDAIIFVPV